MADIFLSYSKQDVDKVRILAALFEAEGYTVWWDANLETGEDFSEAISKQLELARVIVVLWTGNSIHSTFVYAEAMHGHHYEKLVPVKAGVIGYEQLRPPFNALHTVTFEDRDAIVNAVGKRISAPKSVTFRLKRAQFHALVWFGIVGSALAVFSSLDAFVELANWAKWFVHYWRDLTDAIWLWLASLINLQIPPYWPPLLSATLFIVSTLIGARALSTEPKKPASHPATYIVPAFFSLIACAIIFYWSQEFRHAFQEHSEKFTLWGVSYVYVVSSAAIYVGMALVALASQRRPLASVKNWFFGVVSFLIVVEFVLLIIRFDEVATADSSDNQAVRLFLMCLSFLLVVVLPLATPLPALFKRMVTIAVIVICVVGMSELSKLGFDISAPPVPS